MKKKTIMYIILGIFGVLAIVAAILFGGKLKPFFDNSNNKTSLSEKNENPTEPAITKENSAFDSEKSETDSNEQAKNKSETTKTNEEIAKKEISADEAKNIIIKKCGAEGTDELTGNEIFYRYVKKVFNKKDNQSYHYFTQEWLTTAGNTSFLQTIFVSTDGKKVYISPEAHIEDYLSENDVIDIESISELEK